MIDTGCVIFTRKTKVEMVVTAADIGAQLSADYADKQATMLIAWADDVQGWDGQNNRSWIMQCRAIVDAMTSVERAHVAAILDPLVEHLKE